MQVQRRKTSVLDDAFFVFQRRLGLHERSSRLHAASSSSVFGSRVLYAGTLLVLASLLTPVACLVFGFARYAAQQRLDELSRYTRAADGLRYERIDSVSSMVDSQHHSQLHQQLDLRDTHVDVEDMTVI